MTLRANPESKQHIGLGVTETQEQKCKASTMDQKLSKRKTKVVFFHNNAQEKEDRQHQRVVTYERDGTFVGE